MAASLLYHQPYVCKLPILHVNSDISVAVPLMGGGGGGIGVFFLCNLFWFVKADFLIVVD